LNLGEPGQTGLARKRLMASKPLILLGFCSSQRLPKLLRKGYNTTSFFSEVFAGVSVIKT
jgi:hypothetical protein